MKPQAGALMATTCTTGFTPFAAVWGLRATPSWQRFRGRARRQQRTGETHAHFAWLAPLVEGYYDPMYRYQLEKKAQHIAFRGDYHQVDAWLRHRYCASR